MKDHATLAHDPEKRVAVSCLREAAEMLARAD
jgi:hypothetical protein